VVTQAPRGIFVDRAVDGVGLHQSNSAQRQREAMPKHATFKKIQLQASATEIENKTRLHPVAQCPLHRRANQPRFFLAADYFQFNSGLALDALKQAAVVADLARRGHRDGAVGGHVIMIHAIAKMAECANCAGDRFFVQQPPGKGVVAQAHRGAFAFQELDMLGRSGARNRQPDRIGSGINRGQLDGGSQF
jgi:hypothetical protein